MILVTICVACCLNSSLHPVNSDTKIGDQQTHVSLPYPAAECPQLDDIEDREFGDDLSSVAWPNPLYSYPPLLLPRDTALGGQQAHVSCPHPAAECPQLDEAERLELVDDLACAV